MIIWMKSFPMNHYRSSKLFIPIIFCVWLREREKHDVRNQLLPNLLLTEVLFILAGILFSFFFVLAHRNLWWDRRCLPHIRVFSQECRACIHRRHCLLITISNVALLNKKESSNYAWWKVGCISNSEAYISSWYHATVDVRPQSTLIKMTAVILSFHILIALFGMWYWIWRTYYTLLAWSLMTRERFHLHPNNCINILW